MFKPSFSTKKCIFRGVYNSHLNISSGCFLRVISTSRAHAATGKRNFPVFFSDPQGPSYTNGKPGQRMKWKCEDFCSKLQKGVIDSVVKKSSNKRTWLQRQMQEPPNKKWNLFKVSPRFFHMFSARHCHLCFFYIWVQKGGEKRWPVFEVPGFARCQKAPTAGRR